MAAFFICYGLQSIRCETTDFTNLNNLILKALFSVPRLIFGHFEGSDDIFHQKISISKLNQMLNIHFGSTFMLAVVSLEGCNGCYSTHRFWGRFTFTYWFSSVLQHYPHFMGEWANNVENSTHRFKTLKTPLPYHLNLRSIYEIHW